MNSPNETPPQTPPQTDAEFATAETAVVTTSGQHPLPDLSRTIDEIRATKEIKTSNLSYFYRHLEIADGYIQKSPGISLGGCKAIIESIAKLTRQLIKGESLVDLEKEKFDVLVKAALRLLLENPTDTNRIEFCENLVDLLDHIAAACNRHGEIGHGRSSIKVEQEIQSCTQLGVGLTDGLSTYMLRRLFHILKDEEHTTTAESSAIPEP